MCKHGDMFELCGHGFNPYAGSTSVWYGDHGTSSNWDDVYGRWHRDYCTNDNDGPAYASSSSAFTCCRMAQLTCLGAYDVDVVGGAGLV